MTTAEATVDEAKLEQFVALSSATLERL